MFGIVQKKHRYTCSIQSNTPLQFSTAVVRILKLCPVNLYSSPHQVRQLNLEKVGVVRNYEQDVK